MKYRRAPLPGAGPSAARVELGRTLFFDPRLSRASSISCASCHNPGFSWGDGLARGVGFGSKSLGRRTPTVLNVGWGEAFFWDGRAETLEQQALSPIAAPGEMNLPHDEMVKRLQAISGYRPLFAAAFGDRERDQGEGGAGDRRFRAHDRLRRRALRSLVGGRQERALRVGQARVRAVQRQGRLRQVPQRLALHRRQLPRHRRARRRSGAREHPARPRLDEPRVQDADPARRRSPRALHARRLRGARWSRCSSSTTRAAACADRAASPPRCIHCRSRRRIARIWSRSC